MYDRYVKLLDARGLKTSDVSKMTKINPSTFSHWKKGEYQPKRETMQKIADALKLPVSGVCFREWLDCNGCGS